MLTEIISAIQVGMEAGKFAEDLYNGEHMDDVDRAIDMFNAIDWEGNFEPEVREVLQCLDVVNNDDRLYVKVSTWYLRAKCYATLGNFVKARQNISRVLNAQVDRFTLNKEAIADRQRECRKLQSEIKRVEHPEPQYYVETKRQTNQHNNNRPKKENKPKPKQPGVIVTTKQYSRGDLLNIIAGCDNNPLSYSEDSIIKSSPKELRLALQAFSISISTSALAGFNTYRGLINYILEHTQPGASSSSSSKPTVVQQKSKGSSKKQAIDSFVLPIEDKFYIEGRGTVVTGRVAVGKVEVNDELFVVNPSGNKYKTVCVGIEMFKKLLTQAEEGDNCGILLRNVSVSSIQEGAWLQKGEQTIDIPTPAGQKNTTTPMPANKGTTSSPSEEEQEYVEMYKEYVADGEISERDRKMLDKFRSRLGISEVRAHELEASCSKPKLTEDEQEYLEMFKEYAADGEISERDRKMLNKMRDRMGISEERAKEIESL